ncbi:MAG: putative phosphoslipid binding protein [Candidatus Acidoferrum typicum]|nr:putative phosphoslipid binding protein [Candidatus Acidoferrum typicum]
MECKLQRRWGLLAFLVGSLLYGTGPSVAIGLAYVWRGTVVINGSFCKVSWPSWVARDMAIFASLAMFSLGSTRLPTPQQTPDNTEANRPGNTPTAARADQQGQSAQDRELARKIRRSVVTDKSLSTYAHNVKIIAQNGVVTLKGPVRSEEERTAVKAKAVQIAGADSVKDEMSVRPKS